MLINIEAIRILLHSPFYQLKIAPVNQFIPSDWCKCLLVTVKNMSPSHCAIHDIYSVTTNH